jgi:hypothetical protein
MAIFNSYVKLPEGIHSGLEWVTVWPEPVSCRCVKLCLGRHIPLHGELRALLVDSWRIRLDEAHTIGEKHHGSISTCLNIHIGSYCIILSLNSLTPLPGLDSTGTRLCKSQAALACAGLCGLVNLRGMICPWQTWQTCQFPPAARFGDSAVESALMLKALCDRLARVAEALVSLSSN